MCAEDDRRTDEGHGRGSQEAVGNTHSYVDLPPPALRRHAPQRSAHDGDCPAELGPALRERARRARPDREIVVILANREFEAWLLAAAASLAGHRGLPAHLSARDHPEALLAPKEWLARQMPRGYSEILDQPALTSVMDLEQAEGRAPSFAKLVHDLGRVLATLP
jgi:hypothetical protein